jgi:hypothetical protein
VIEVYLIKIDTIQKINKYNKSYIHVAYKSYIKDKILQLYLFRKNYILVLKLPIVLEIASQITNP